VHLTRKYNNFCEAHDYHKHHMWATASVSVVGYTTCCLLAEVLHRP